MPRSPRAVRRAAPGRASPSYWRALYTAWEDHQQLASPRRQSRYAAMLDVLEASLPRRPRILDLACGPGPTTQRLLARFPRASVVAVDVDPVVLRVGRERFGSAGGRLTWIEADLARPGWERALPGTRYDAAVSTTALHWLRRRELGPLYRGLARALRRGGVYANGDYLPVWAATRRFGRLEDDVDVLRHEAPGARDWWKRWERWWDRAEASPYLREEVAARARKFGSSHPVDEDVPLDAHVRALRRARFYDAGVVWQEFDDRVLVAVR